MSEVFIPEVKTEDLYIGDCCRYCDNTQIGCTDPRMRDLCSSYHARKQRNDNVHHPQHYGGKDNPYEVIKVLEAWLTEEEFRGFCKGNAIKYEARHKMKGGLEDLRKAEWYMNYYNEYAKRKGLK